MLGCAVRVFVYGELDKRLFYFLVMRAHRGGGARLVWRKWRCYVA